MNTATATKKFALATLAAPVLAALAIGMAGTAHADNGTVNHPLHNRVSSDTGRGGSAGTNGMSAGQSVATGGQGGNAGLLSVFAALGSGGNDGKADRMILAKPGQTPTPLIQFPWNSRNLSKDCGDSPRFD